MGGDDVNEPEEQSQQYPDEQAQEPGHQPQQQAGGIHGVPQEVLERAREDFEWASRLLHVDTRHEALAELQLEGDGELDARLDELANSTLREAVTRFGGGQQLQP